MYACSIVSTSSSTAREARRRSAARRGIAVTSKRVRRSSSTVVTASVHLHYYGIEHTEGAILIGFLRVYVYSCVPGAFAVPSLQCDTTADDSDGDDDKATRSCI